MGCRGEGVGVAVRTVVLRTGPPLPIYEDCVECLITAVRVIAETTAGGGGGAVRVLLGYPTLTKTVYNIRETKPFYIEIKHDNTCMFSLFVITGVIEDFLDIINIFRGRRMDQVRCPSSIL